MSSQWGVCSDDVHETRWRDLIAREFSFMLSSMNNCPCIKSVKSLITTGQWAGCECGNKLPIGHLTLRVRLV